MISNLPPEVIAWRDAYGEYINATLAYNVRLAAIREREAKRLTDFGRDSPQAEYEAMHNAQMKALKLLGPMYEAIKE